MSSDTQTGGPVAGWYPDPLEQADLRWFDGSGWTDQTREHPQAAASAEPVAAAEVEAEAESAPTAATSPASRRPGRRAIIGIVVGVAVLALGAWLLLGRGGDEASTDSSAGSNAGSAQELPEGVQGQVEGTPTLGDPQAAIDAASQQAAWDAIESINAGMQTCSVRNEDGGYKGCTPAVLIEVSPSLRPVLESCGTPGGGCVKLIGTDGYEVRVQDTFAPPRTWIEIHAAGDSVTRTCEPAGCTDSGTWDPEADDS